VRPWERTAERPRCRGMPNGIPVGTPPTHRATRRARIKTPRQADDDLREQVRYLREQLRREQDAHAEARRIIAGLVQRIPELEAPREAEARETPETATAETEGTSPRSDAPGPQTGAQRRPWWRRVLGR
jgi:hypothetical protein